MVLAAQSYEVMNPASEELAGTAPEQTPAEAQAAVAAAKAAAPRWAATPIEERARLLRAAGARMERDLDRFARIVQAETGGTTSYVRQSQVGEAAKRFTHFADLSLTLADERLQSVGEGDARIGAAVTLAPLGVAACIAPYSTPLLTGIGKIAPALAMGNTVVLKPAVQTPLSALALGELLQEVGLPDGVVNIVTGSSPETSKAIVASPDVDMVSFTGSTRVGAEIAAVAGPRFARLLLELGGKGGAVVFEDADMDRMVAAMSSIFTRYSGQVCTAPSRLIVARSRYAEAVERISAIADGLVVGDPSSPDTVVGPVISAAHRDRVNGMIERAVQDGGRRTAGGGRALPSRGYYVPPTVIVDADPGAEIMQQEVFGPVLAVTPFDTVDQAADILDGTSYGLSNYLWTRDLDAGRRFARRIRSGTVAINTGQRHPSAPFGGVKNSGVGREGGAHSLFAYAEPESIIWSEAS